MQKVKQNRQKSYYFGIFAELIAIIYLKLKFYRILKNRYRSKAGEIDIIAKKGKNIIFIEVKARRKNQHIMEVLSKYQQNRINRSALIFIAQNPQFNNYQPRFDLILVSPKMLVKHLKNAWWV